ncbi:DUF2164 domain-containing protein [Virgibacillus sp. W0181]|uniref:DUF2164 domain-containing protein n=1 Tax=Virgibacillus sp. W0181 TaxID=3391581 RepID=UPI003F45612F
MKANFNLTKEQKDEMVGHIQHYFEMELDKQIGNLTAMMILDFITEKFGPTFYNLGVEDSHSYMTEKIDDIFEIQKG